MAIRIKLARSKEEQAAVFKFRYRVYVDELGKPITDADHERKLVVDPGDEGGLLFAAYDDGDLVGTLRLNNGLASMRHDPRLPIYDLHLFDDCAPETFSFASRLMLRSDYRGSLAAHRLCVASLESALEAGVRLCFCYCAPYLVSFYEQMGFRRYTDNFQDELGYRIPMVMVLFDHAHLTAVRSPLVDRIPPPAPNEDWGGFFATKFNDFVAPANARIVSTDQFYQLLNRKLHDDPLQSIPLLRGLSKDQADSLLKAGTVISVEMGDTLIRAGEANTEIYVLLSAMVGVRSPNFKRMISILGPGELIGEMAFLMGSTRTANVEVVRGGELLVLSERNVQHLMRHNPNVAYRLMYNLARILCERLAATTRNLTEEVTPGAPLFTGVSVP